MDTKQPRPLPLAVLGKVRMLDREIARHSAAVESHIGVRSTELWLLHAVQLYPGIRLTEVADFMSLMQASASNILERMVKRGYIEKVHDLLDKRVIGLWLTPAGLQFLSGIPVAAQCPLRRLSEITGPDSLTPLDAALNHVLIELERLGLCAYSDESSARH